MMLDTAIIVPIETFLQGKNTYVVDETIVKRYEQLIGKYECFNKVIYYHKGNAIKGPEKKKPVFKNDERKTPKKSFTSLWNTLNESNYAKISHRLKFMINDENITTVVKELVHMSIIHSIYRKYFMYLLKDVINLAPPKTDVIDILMKHIATFDNAYYVITHVDTVSPQYDDFCKLQKHKTKIMQTQAFMLDIIMSDIKIPYTLEQYWDNIWNCIGCVLDIEYYLDIYLNIVQSLLETLKTKCVSHRGVLNCIKESLSMVNDSGSMKLRFMIENVHKQLHHLYHLLDSQ